MPARDKKLITAVRRMETACNRRGKCMALEKSSMRTTWTEEAADAEHAHAWQVCTRACEGQ
eukprot:scaffold17041_cov14-Tisochrysis_lutea.AAC.2